MSDLNEIYKDLTRVDIEEQKRLWDERGKGYYGEYLLFRELYQHVEGQCKILMNLNIPAEHGKTTEIDLLMIHESGLYVFEAKHYKGTIYGHYGDDTWTQYFRTQKNSHFHSPVKQNEYHIAALNRLFPELPAYSFVVFTNDETVVKVTGWEESGIVICRIGEIPWYIEQISSNSGEKLSGEQIDAIFGQLSEYSPMKQETVASEAAVIPLTGYLNEVKKDYASALEEARRAEKKKYKRKTGLAVIAALIACAAAFLGAFMTWGIAQQRIAAAEKAQASAEQELAEFEKKFHRAEPMNGGNVELEDHFLEPFDVVLEPSADLKDTVLFSCKIKVNGVQYGVRLHQYTSVIVGMKDGTVSEYILSRMNGFSQRTVAAYAPGFFSDTAELPQIQIFTSEVSDISNIKLTNVSIVDQKGGDGLIPGVEFELYTAE